MTKNDDDELSKLSPADQEKLAALQVEWGRDGDAALHRLAEKDPVFYLRLLELYHPKAVRRAVENALIDAGLTNSDIQKMLENAKTKH
jgi:hypothetical protein